MRKRAAWLALGEGDGSAGQTEVSDAKWLVVRVLASEIKHGSGVLIGKCKFPRGCVVHCGDRKLATEYIMKHGANGKAVIGSTVTAGDYGTATAGGLRHRHDRGQWHRHGRARRHHHGRALRHRHGRALRHRHGRALRHRHGKGQRHRHGRGQRHRNGRVLRHRHGRARWHSHGRGTTAQPRQGDRGTATAGYGGTAMAGDNGTICIKYYDAQNGRYRIAVACAGENGIMPNRKYTLNDSHEFVEVK